MSAAVPLSWPALPRRASVAAAVIAAHAALLWWAQRASIVHAVPEVVPVQLIEAILTPPEVQHAAPPARRMPPPRPQHRIEAPHARTMPRPQRAAVHAPVPAPVAPAAASVRAPVSPAAPVPPVAPAPRETLSASAPALPTPAPAPAPAPARAKVELPVSDADYLQNPKPEWPRASQRLGEKGLVVVRVLIGTDGRARKAEIAQSSGYPRLDNASVAAVLGWRYVPGKRGGVPEEMWVKVPIRWGD